jgi:hypothetical protein
MPWKLDNAKFRRAPFLIIWQYGKSFQISFLSCFDAVLSSIVVIRRHLNVNAQCCKLWTFTLFQPFIVLTKSQKHGLMNVKVILVVMLEVAEGFQYQLY